MVTASISDIKARLSHYLRLVRRGEEVQILDRGLPVARLIGNVRDLGGRDDERLARLVQAGVLRPGTGEASWVLETEPVVTGTSLTAALTEDREDRF
jgi:prevent-host-death family protein